MTPRDFIIGTDEVGQRYAYPASLRGRTYFDAHAGDFDMSENGWELDTTATAFTAFEDAVSVAGLRYEVAS